MGLLFGGIVVGSSPDTPYKTLDVENNLKCEVATYQAGGETRSNSDESTYNSPNGTLTIKV